MVSKIQKSKSIFPHHAFSHAFIWSIILFLYSLSSWQWNHYRHYNHWGPLNGCLAPQTHIAGSQVQFAWSAHSSDGSLHGLKFLQTTVSKSIGPLLLSLHGVQSPWSAVSMVPGLHGVWASWSAVSMVSGLHGVQLHGVELQTNSVLWPVVSLDVSVQRVQLQRCSFHGMQLPKNAWSMEYNFCRV